MQPEALCDYDDRIFCCLPAGLEMLKVRHRDFTVVRLQYQLDLHLRRPLHEGNICLSCLCH